MIIQALAIYTYQNLRILILLILTNLSRCIHGRSVAALQQNPEAHTRTHLPRTQRLPACGHPPAHTERVHLFGQTFERVRVTSFVRLEVLHAGLGLLGDDRRRGLVAPIRVGRSATTTKRGWVVYESFGDQSWQMVFRHTVYFEVFYFNRWRAQKVQLIFSF